MEEQPTDKNRFERKYYLGLDKNYIFKSFLIQNGYINSYDPRYDLTVETLTKIKDFIKTVKNLDEFKEIIAYKVNLYLDISLEKTYELMIHSDILILSRSSFSFVPAFYNKRCVIYYPFWHKKLNHWLDSTKHNFNVKLEKEIKNLILKYHS